MTFRALWECGLSVRRAFPEKRELVRKNGEERVVTKSVPVTIRALYLRALTPVVGPDTIRVVLRQLKDKRTNLLEPPSYCLSGLVRLTKPLWNELKLRPDPPPRWKKIETLDEAGFLKWLRHRIDNAEAALMALKFADPEN